MKRIFFIILISTLFVFSSCDKDGNNIQFKSSGKILGVDIGTCACCGNWKILIKEDKKIYEFINLPENSKIDLEDISFPIEVKLNWRVNTDHPCGFIIIDDIELN